MRRNVIIVGLGACGAVLFALCGCPIGPSISIVSTSCEPVNLAVSEIVTLKAKVKDEGENPSYSWKVISVDPPPSPPDEVVGSFANSSGLEARFTPSRQGMFRIRFTAGDGISADSWDCPLITVEGRPQVAVRLEFEPETPMVDALVALECSDNDGETEAVTFEIKQVLDPLPPSLVTLMDISEGQGQRVVFEVSRPGTYLFSCIGTNAETEPESSAPFILAVEVSGTPGNSNGNQNENGNDNSNANQNDNQNEPAPNENANDNAASNANDNERK